MTALKGRTPGEDIYEALKSVIESRNVEVKSIISLTTERASAMLGRGKNWSDDY